MHIRVREATKGADGIEADTLGPASMEDESAATEHIEEDHGYCCCHDGRCIVHDLHVSKACGHEGRTATKAMSARPTDR